ncbi:Hsp70 family protein [Flavobacterium selenitireducens]|uniref:Hsp70 family protein n=1 Tax=Flavobacterium selenitireducens TaxID=2722704 RepID=UPI00168BF306|nr:Hsp70 family protein [Flavobacterium selenitireducens]MBD3581628.1 Hsp70 family protein [Flavobacterium selenitireducens]
MANINYGIDLGTTNSAISKYEDGKIHLFKNPVGFRDTIPSVVAFRKGTIRVGDKAREQILTNPGNVFSSFKRKMGSDQIYDVPDTGQTITPVGLSAMVLKELLGFVPDETLSSIAITIPASFDTIQSNATKKAGYEAGFGEVVLLQEPIAACLAYSNSLNIDITEDKKWLVYDFGGGTFDAALVSISHRELKVVDHKGNNFLGGLDLDNLVVEKILCPKIEAKTGLTGLWQNMVKGEDTSFKKLYFELLFKAEEAKKELSVKSSAIIEIDSDEPEIMIDIEISQQEFEAVIQPKFNESYSLVEKLVQSNGLRFSDIERIILVGGTTYIPYVRRELHERSGVVVDSGIDPTTAVVIGAAYYAGSKPSAAKAEFEPETGSDASPSISAEFIFEPNSQDSEELLACIVPPNFQGYYRITRADGGYDSGMQPMTGKFSVFVPLLQKATNLFSVGLFDQNQQSVLKKSGIAITNGLYNVQGQPLPNDICLELDEESGTTYLESIFRKNDILPIKKTVYKQCSKNILKQSDDKLVINIVEGNAGGMIGSNLSIGYLEINGRDLDQDLLKGIDIELNFKITESRDLSVTVYIGALDLEINEVFNPHERKVSIDKLRSEVKDVIDQIQREIYEQEDEENFEYLARLKRTENLLVTLYNEAELAAEDNSTDKKYQLDEAKRLLIQEFDDLVRHRFVLEEADLYKDMKAYYNQYAEKATPSQIETFNKIVAGEKDFLQSGNRYVIRKKAKELESLADAIWRKQDERFVDHFYYYRYLDLDGYSDKRKAEKLFERGEHAIDKTNYVELRAICSQLWNMLKVKPKSDTDFENFDGNLGLK